MNSARQHIKENRNLLHFFRWTMKYHKEKVKKQSLLKLYQKWNRNKLDLGCERCTCWELSNMNKGNKMIQSNGKISYGFGLEEIILLKWSYYPKQSTNLMWSLSNYQELGQIILKFRWNHKRPRIDKGFLRKNEKARGIKNLQTILHSYSNQNNMVLAQNHTYR